MAIFGGGGERGRGEGLFNRCPAQRQSPSFDDGGAYKSTRSDLDSAQSKFIRGGARPPAGAACSSAAVGVDPRMLSALGSSKGEVLGQDVLARHMSTKVHSWRGKYQRVWAIKKDCLQHADPADFSVTNVWPWNEVVVSRNPGLYWIRVRLTRPRRAGVCPRRVVGQRLYAHCADRR